MARVKLTDEQKLATLKEKLERARKMKSQYAKQESILSAELEALEAKERLKVMDSILNDPDKLTSLFDLGIISQEQLNTLKSDNSPQK